ncbi:MAG: DUF364 domain-containing protein, partial [Proteobacteria bacterium]|nr:DUF364 domain-containing protein [Pseudomonadota bacterium]
MGILDEAADLVGRGLGDDIDCLTVERLVVGLFFTGVKLTGGQGGVCFTPIKDIPGAVCCPSSAGRVFDPVRVRGVPVKEVLSGLNSVEPIKTAVAIATLGALSATCWGRGIKGDYQIQTRLDAQDRVDMPPEKSVAVIGAFVPVLQRLKRRGGAWWVVEQDPATLKGEELDHYVPAAESMEVIAQADVLVITGVTLINHTLEGI